VLLDDAKIRRLAITIYEPAFGIIGDPAKRDPRTRQSADHSMVYIIASVIDLLAARFGGQRNFANAVKLSVYSHTPLWLAGIFLLIPGLNFLLILGIYGLYLLWTGLPLLMQVPDEKALPYAAVVTACALVPAVVLAIV